MTCTPIGSVSPSVHTGTAATGRPMKEIGWVKIADVRPDQQLLAVEHESLLAEFWRAAGSRGREQDVHVPEQFQRLRPEQPAEFLRLGYPGARQHGAGDQAVAHVRVEVLGAGLQPLQMQRRALRPW